MGMRPARSTWPWPVASPEGLPRASGILTTDCWLVWSTIWANIRMLSSGESATPIIAKEIKALKKTDPELDRRLRDYMCDQFFDIRTFGAVMTTFVKGNLSCGQVRGPVQLGFARSIDPISVQEISITRIAVTTEADAAEKNNTMGNKFIIPYGLYRMNGYISAKLAQNVTGFCDEDLDVLWQAILNMFEFDRSAARGNMAVRKLYVFKHSSALGDAPSWKLFDSIDVHKRDEVDVPRDFGDYEVRVNREAIPESVSLTEMVDHTL